MALKTQRDQKDALALDAVNGAAESSASLFNVFRDYHPYENVYGFLGRLGGAEVGAGFLGTLGVVGGPATTAGGIVTGAYAGWQSIGQVLGPAGETFGRGIDWVGDTVLQTAKSVYDYGSERLGFSRADVFEQGGRDLGMFAGEFRDFLTSSADSALNGVRSFANDWSPAAVLAGQALSPEQLDFSQDLGDVLPAVTPLDEQLGIRDIDTAAVSADSPLAMSMDQGFEPDASEMSMDAWYGDAPAAEHAALEEVTEPPQPDNYGDVRAAALSPVSYDAEETAEGPDGIDI